MIAARGRGDVPYGAPESVFGGDLVSADRARAAPWRGGRGRRAARTGCAAWGIVAVGTGGHAIEVELHDVPTAVLGDLLTALPAPPALGRIHLCE